MLKEQLKFELEVEYDGSYPDPRYPGGFEDRDFFGRTDAVNKSVAVLTTQSTPVVVRGERRAGKTSLMQCVASHLQHGVEVGPLGTVVPALVPFREWMPLKDVLDKILVLAFLRLRKLQPSLVFAADRQYGVAGEGWLSVLRQMLDSVPDVTLLVAVDELDSYVREAQLKGQKDFEDYVRWARALAETPDAGIKCLYSVSPSDLPDDANIGSLLRQCEQVQVGPLSADDFRDMVHSLVPGTTLATAYVESLRQLSGSWPYFGKALLLYLGEQPFDAAAVETAFRALLQPGFTPAQLTDLGPHALGLYFLATSDQVRAYLDSFYPHHLVSDEQKAVMLLAARGVRRLDPAALEQDGRDLRTAVAQLERRGWLSLDRDGAYVLTVPVLALLLRFMPAFRAEEDRLLGRPPQQQESAHVLRSSEPDAVVTIAEHEALLSTETVAGTSLWAEVCRLRSLPA